MRILIADDHPMMRDALARTLQAVAPEARVAEAGDLAGCEAALAAGPVSLALVDLHMPGMDGVAGLRLLRRQYPSVPLVVVSGDAEPGVVRAAFAAGAVGFLPKGESAEVLQQALRLVLGGGSYMPALALADLRPGAAPPRSEPPQLTQRQRDVLACLQRGLPNKSIARELGLAEGTVKIHLAALLRALQARNRTEAVIRARELGLPGG